VDLLSGHAFCAAYVTTQKISNGKEQEKIEKRDSVFWFSKEYLLWRNRVVISRRFYFVNRFLLLLFFSQCKNSIPFFQEKTDREREKRPVVGLQHNKTETWQREENIFKYGS